MKLKNENSHFQKSSTSGISEFPPFSGLSVRDKQGDPCLELKKEENVAVSSILCFAID